MNFKEHVLIKVKKLFPERRKSRTLTMKLRIIKVSRDNYWTLYKEGFRPIALDVKSRRLTYEIKEPLLSKFLVVLGPDDNYEVT